MMLCLILDVRNYRIHLRLAHGEHAVTALPCEFFVIWRERLYPSAAVAFHLLHHMCDGFYARKQHQCVDVIAGSAHAQHLASGGVDERPDIAVQLFQMFVFDDRTGGFYMKNDV